MNSVSSASRSRVASTKSVESTLETKRKVSSRLDVVAQRLVGHHRPQVRAADADVDDVADRLAGVALPLAGAHAVGERAHPVEHLVDLGDDVDAVDDQRAALAACAGRRAARERFSETLMRSPPNIASVRSARPDCSASATSSLSVSSVIAVLRVVEEQAGALGGQALAAGRRRRRTARADAARGSPRSASPGPSRPAARAAGGCSSSCSSRPPGVVRSLLHSRLAPEAAPAPRTTLMAKATPTREVCHQGHFHPIRAAVAPGGPVDGECRRATEDPRGSPPMSAHDHAAHAGPGYASPQVAREQPPEKFIYVAALYEGTGIDKPDFIAVVDVDPESADYGQIVHRTEMPNVGDELHHFGWNACSSACHSQLSRDTLIVPGLPLLADPPAGHLRSAQAHDQERHRGRGDQGEAGAERAAHRPLHARRHRHDLDAGRRRRQLARRVRRARRARLLRGRALGARRRRRGVHVRLLVPAAPEHARLQRVGRAQHVPGRLQPRRRGRGQVRPAPALLGPGEREPRCRRSTSATRA